MKHIQIFLTGPPGSGKTYCAKQLSNILDLSTYPLDDFRYIKPKRFDPRTYVPQRRSDEEFQKEVITLLNTTDWIIEGVVREYIDGIYERANAIVIMKTPRIICTIRGFKRALERTWYNYHICNFLHVGWLYPNKNFVMRRIWRNYPRHQAKIASLLVGTSLPVFYIRYGKELHDIQTIVEEFQSRCFQSSY